MRARSLTRRLFVLCVVGFGLLIALPGVGRAVQIVHEGFDLFLTLPPASFDFNTVPNPQIVDFEGLPIGCFNFGSGCVSTGVTDTIVERLEATFDIDGGFSDTIDIELVALSLISINPIDLGFGAGFEDLFVTLNTSSPSIQSTMTITDGGGVVGSEGTFDSTLNFSFDVTGSVGGFYATIEQTFNSVGASWWHNHQPSELTIDGVNFNLAGSPDQDFFLYPFDSGGNQQVLHTGPHPVIPTPEPGTALLLGLGLAGLGWRGGRNAHLAAPRNHTFRNGANMPHPKRSCQNTTYRRY